MADFDKNHAVIVLREKIASLSGEVKEHIANLDRMLLVSQKWDGYQVILSMLESKVTSLEAKKVKLESVEASLRQELQNTKLYRDEVVSKVVPYVAMELVNGDDMGRLVAKLVYASILYGRCQAFEEVAKMNELFDITKVKGYKSSYKQEHTRGGNELATSTFPFLAEVVADPHASVEALLSKKPRVLQRPAPTRTYVPASSTLSEKATPSPALMSLSSQITHAAASALENQLLSVSLLICLEKHDCVERIPSANTNVLLLHLNEKGIRRDEKKRLDYLKQDLRIGKKMWLVTHGLEGYEFEKTCNNDKNLSEIQLEHEKDDELVAVVVNVMHEWDDFGVYVLRFHTCLTDILGFLEKLEWWFEQDIDDEGEEDEEDGGGGKV
uniref:Uncharacterized protein n=1 Tax=Tanacetum cinerariifolium TaxID=118510 RepID=A0A6L2MFL1_TANCI|nr:hypothetical protein [Tanacetum cinerariifolium]